MKERNICCLKVDAKTKGHAPNGDRTIGFDYTWDSLDTAQEVVDEH